MVLSLSTASRCGGACSQGRMSCPTPYTCSQQRLTAASIDRRIAAKQERRALPELLLATGAMEGPFRRSRPLTLSPLARIRRALRSFLIHRKGTL